MIVLGYKLPEGTILKVLDEKDGSPIKLVGQRPERAMPGFIPTKITVPFTINTEIVSSTIEEFMREVHDRNENEKIPPVTLTDRLENALTPEGKKLFLDSPDK